MNAKNVLVLGATSSIARAAANAFAQKGYSLYLGGRDLGEISKIAKDIQIRHGTDVRYGYFDAENFGEHEAFLKGVIAAGGLEGVLVAFGDLGDHTLAIKNFAAAQTILNRNFIGACSILTHCANYLSQQKRGFIVGVSSVAGDRGRQSNYIYGAAKGGFGLFLQGLRNRLFRYNVRVITIKPGFVDTAMTFGKPGLFMVASPDYVGKKIANAPSVRRDVVYIPGFWKYLMHIIKNLPEWIFKRLKL